MSVRNLIQSLTHAGDNSERGTHLVNAEILNGSVSEGSSIHVRFTYTDRHPVSTRNAFAIRSADFHACYGGTTFGGEMGPGDSIDFQVGFGTPVSSISAVAGWNVAEGQPLEACQLGEFGFNYIPIDYVEVLSGSLPSLMEVRNCNVTWDAPRHSVDYAFDVLNPTQSVVEAIPVIQINDLDLLIPAQDVPPGGTVSFSGEAPIVASQKQDMGGEGTHDVSVSVRRASRQ